MEALRQHGWGFVYTPGEVARPSGVDLPYFLDNGAWGCFQRELPFDGDAFRNLLVQHGTHADFVVCPDIVGGGRASLDFSLSWLEEVRAAVPVPVPVLIPVQEGMTPDDLRSLLGPAVGLFVGGKPVGAGGLEWKEATLAVWGALARGTGCWLHVGRVNTARRIHACLPWAHSFDGTSATRFSKNLPMLDAARRVRVAAPFCGPLVPGLDALNEPRQDARPDAIPDPDRPLADAVPGAAPDERPPGVADISVAPCPDPDGGSDVADPHRNLHLPLRSGLPDGSAGSDGEADPARRPPEPVAVAEPDEVWAAEARRDTRTCSKCGHVGSLRQDFGLRRCKTGNPPRVTVRSQPQCRPCRSGRGPWPGSSAVGVVGAAAPA